MRVVLSKEDGMVVVLAGKVAFAGLIIWGWF